ncbi:integrase arm-type DNA-binding domain-containing protein [Laribacter hongkongensis]|uniref:integrase arm-type DNA-binding domain-containing protein n=1 Tax=Laribacter hongkongensis TaxID=168471 RepID=UPI0027E45683|nr:integrase arm-type DNA-binding domain-containing protein [Laribacter hongkongensis]MCG8996276.1 integrase arm-type DNA-binding domain-containing protein [Laribacter hongkongensis]MCG9011383.1 integrase arm-type DNA-binding domain-containing protein [Laribacter hongkongensis]MCG9023367.1 integrase arm-type DNA-binding domain-containing protein [Laribacter hongkongensis]MCG9048218.1 integrase arm-type DNA-binding domain-containing protein [Laribacter hongkongensis]MCG9075157.1 integrase arm-t
MAGTTVPLTDTACRNTKPKDKDYSLFDGQGLYLLVKTNGIKSWRMKYIKPNGKQGLTSFGNYPAISLAIARKLRAKAIDLLATGTDPVVHKQQAKAASIAIASNIFEAVTREWHDKIRGKWSHDHAGRILKRQEQNLFPAIGKHLIAHLTTLDYLDTLRQSNRCSRPLALSVLLTKNPIRPAPWHRSGRAPCRAENTVNQKKCIALQCE